MSEIRLPLPEEADLLTSGNVRLCFSELFPGNVDQGLVPCYHFEGADD